MKRPLSSCVLGTGLQFELVRTFVLYVSRVLDGRYDSQLRHTEVEVALV